MPFSPCAFNFAACALSFPLTSQAVRGLDRLPKVEGEGGDMPRAKEGGARARDLTDLAAGAAFQSTPA